MNIKLSAVELQSFVKNNGDRTVITFPQRANGSVPFVSVRVKEDTMQVVNNPLEVGEHQIKQAVKKLI